MKTIVPLFLKKIFPLLSLLLFFTVINAQNGSECYKPFTGAGKTAQAFQFNLVCVGCNVSSLGNLIDGDKNNSVELGQLVGIAPGSGVSVKDEMDTPGGYYAGYVIGLSPSQLNVNVLNGFTIQTYNDGALQQSVTGAALTASPLLGTTPQKTYLYFKTDNDKPFDEVRFIFSNLVSGLSALDVYYAMTFDPDCGNNESNAICDDAIQGPGTVVTFNGGLVCALCNLINANHIIDADKNNYAILSLPVGAITSSSVGVLDEQNIYPAGYRAGFIITPDQANALLDANVLNNITVETYLFGELQESQTFSSGSGLLSVAALSASGTPKVKIGFVTTQQFNEVRLKVNQPVGVSIQPLRIYGAFEEPPTCNDCQEALTSNRPNPYTGTLVTGTNWTNAGGLTLDLPFPLPNLTLPGTLTDEGNVVNSDLTDYAIYTPPVLDLGLNILGLVNETDFRLTVSNGNGNNGPLFPAGTFGGFVIQEEGGLLDIGLLNAVTITLYNGTTPVASQSGASLVSSGALTLTGGKTVVGFKSPAAFNRIQISIDNGLLYAGGFLGREYRIYYAFVINDTDNDGTPDCVDVCPSGADNMDTDGDGTPDACDNCNTGIGFPALGATSFFSPCPFLTYDLSTVSASNTPAGAIISFHTGTPATSTNRLSDITAVGTGTYYAAFFDAANNCFGATVEIQIASPCTTLPVVLSSFTASLNTNNTVSLNWATGVENKLSHFVVEKSTDGMNYSEAGVVFAQNSISGSNNYSFIDENINTEQDAVIYYRIRMVDIDKQNEVSSARTVRIRSSSEEVFSISVYPNPTSRDLTVKVPAEWQGRMITIDLISMNGKLVKRTTAGGTTVTINIAELKPGVYLLRANSGGIVVQQKVIKQ